MCFSQIAVPQDCSKEGGSDFLPAPSGNIAVKFAKKLWNETDTKMFFKRVSTQKAPVVLKYIFKMQLIVDMQVYFISIRMIWFLFYDFKNIAVPNIAIWREVSAFWLPVLLQFERKNTGVPNYLLQTSCTGKYLLLLCAVATVILYARGLQILPLILAQGLGVGLHNIDAFFAPRNILTVVDIGFPQKK